MTGSGRYEYVDVIDKDAPGADHPVAVQIAGAARRLIAELGGAGSPREALAAARDLAAAADAAMQAAIDLARAAGYSWREIGEVLGTTRQAAFQRFGRPVDPRTGEPMSRDVPADAADRAVAIFTWHNEGRWEEILAELDDRIGALLDADRLARGWAHMAGLFGRFEGTGEPFARRAGDDVMVDVPLHWEAGDARGIVRFDTEGKVAGLAIRPLPGEPGSSHRLSLLTSWRCGSNGLLAVASSPEALLGTLLGESVARANLNPRRSGLAGGLNLGRL